MTHVNHYKYCEKYLKLVLEQIGINPQKRSYNVKQYLPEVDSSDNDITDTF